MFNQYPGDNPVSSFVTQRSHETTQDSEVTKASIKRAMFINDSRAVSLDGDRPIREAFRDLSFSCVRLQWGNGAIHQQQRLQPVRAVVVGRRYPLRNLLLRWHQRLRIYF